MKIIGAGVRSVWMAVSMGDSLWPPLTILAASIVIAIVVAVRRAR